VRLKHSTVGVKVPYQKIDESLDLALEATLVMCKNHDNMGSIITPRYLTESTWLKSCTPNGNIKTFA